MQKFAIAANKILPAFLIIAAFSFASLVNSAIHRQDLVKNISGISFSIAFFVILTIFCFTHIVEYYSQKK